MAKSTLVTADAVFAAADALEADGKVPSLRAVRSHLGGGSFGSILPFLQSWRRTREESEGADEDEAELPPLPPGVAAALDKLVATAADVAESVVHAQQAAKTEAEDALAEKLEALDAERAQESAAEAAEAAQLKQQVADLQQMATREIARLRTERDRLVGELEESRREVAELRAWRQRAMEHMRGVGGAKTDAG